MTTPKLGDGQAEIRLTLRDGAKIETLDEVVACKPEFFHLEQMDKDHWWMRIDLPGGRAVVVNLTARGEIKGNAHRE